GRTARVLHYFPSLQRRGSEFERSQIRRVGREIPPAVGSRRQNPAHGEEASRSGHLRLDEGGVSAREPDRDRVADIAARREGADAGCFAPSRAGGRTAVEVQGLLAPTGNKHIGELCERRSAPRAILIACDEHFHLSTIPLEAYRRTV